MINLLFIKNAQCMQLNNNFNCISSEISRNYTKRDKLINFMISTPFLVIRTLNTRVRMFLFSISLHCSVYFHEWEILCSSHSMRGKFFLKILMSERFHFQPRQNDENVNYSFTANWVRIVDEDRSFVEDAKCPPSSKCGDDLIYLTWT